MVKNPEGTKDVGQNPFLFWENEAKEIQKKCDSKKRVFFPKTG